MTYENIIITLILLVDSVNVYLAFKAELRRAKARTTRKFNKILNSIGIK